MTDEPEDSPVEVTACGAEWHTYSTGCVVFPKGIAEFAESVHALAIRIADKTGDIEILAEVGKGWSDAARNPRAGTLAAVK